MGSYPTKVVRLLGPYSNSQVYPDILKEWYATGLMEDNEEADEDCQVCGHENIRYLFEIKNQLNGNIRERTGSRCIIKFPEIGVFDGERITYDPEEKRRVINNIVELHRRKQRGLMRQDIARKIWSAPGNEDHKKAPLKQMRAVITVVGKRAEEDGLLSPWEFALFVEAAEISRVEVPMAAFQGIVTLRTNDAKKELKSLLSRDIERIKGALTSPQLVILERHRGKP